MYLLATGSSEIETKFGGILLKNGPTVTVGSFSGLSERLSATPPALIILDLGLTGGVTGGLPGLDSKTAIADLRQRVPGVKILAVGADFSPEAELALLKAGVVGCCNTALAEDAIPRIIEMVLGGGIWISHAVLSLLLTELRGLGATAQSRRPAPDRMEELTPRERQIADLVAGGASNKLIARQLDITDRTVKAHLGTIFQKLGVSDRLQLGLYVIGSAPSSGKTV